MFLLREREIIYVNVYSQTDKIKVLHVKVFSTLNVLKFNLQIKDFTSTKSASIVVFICLIDAGL